MKNLISAFKKENKELRKHALIRNKFWATCLFILMAIIFLLAHFFQDKSIILNYIKATAEAGMVGALADWFAVVALFRHPMGLPIPHTAIIKKNKDELGNSLGNFVQDHFLTPENIMNELNAYNIAGEGIKLIEKNREAILSKVFEIIPKILSIINKIEIREVIVDKLQNVKFAGLISEIIEMLTKENKHQDLLELTIKEIKKILNKNKDVIVKIVKDESHFYVPAFVNKIIANKIIKGLNNQFDTVLDDTGNKFRKIIDNFVHEKIHTLKSDKKTQDIIDNNIKSIFINKIVGDYFESVWESLKCLIEEDLKDDKSKIRKGIRSGFDSIVLYFETDEKMLSNIDYGIKEVIKDILVEEKDKISKIISKKVKDTSADDVSDMIENYIGKDLQFIRMNGTIVGSIVGLVIYTVSQLI